jgi:hypothetical protein
MGDLYCDYCEKEIYNENPVKHETYEKGERITVWLHEYCYKSKHIDKLKNDIKNS